MPITSIMDTIVVTMVVAALHRNYLHKAFTIGAGCFALSKVCAADDALQYAPVRARGLFRARPCSHPSTRSSRRPALGLFPAGADSGMGEATVLHLCDVRLRARLHRAALAGVGKEAPGASSTRRRGRSSRPSP